jgi:squalene synthase HpnD
LLRAAFVAAAREGKLRANVDNRVRPSTANAAIDAREVRARVSGSSFYAGMRLLPRPEREAMFAIYAFCRAVDDIADDGLGSRADRRAELDRWRQDIEAHYAGRPTRRTEFLAQPVHRYNLRKEDFLTVVDGMEMDVVEDIQAPDFATFDLYCDRVASAVGRLSVRVFGMEEGPGLKLAHHLGRALQYTNVLRDLDEDAAVGRLYLPRDTLLQAGIASRDPSEVIANSAVDKAARSLARFAHEHYREAQNIIRARPRGLLRAPRLMAAVYWRILKTMEAAGWVPPRRRARIGRSQLLFIVLRHGLWG